ncbi:MAG: FAD:protein FMN transferase, partial [Campylobacterota bacterium]|nr:FAD:protein FMN transferase [Campylobacterota bacterium]
MIRFLSLCVILALPLSSEILTRTQVGMGTFVTISVSKKDKKYIEDGFSIIKDVELSLSSYNENSPIYRLNRDKKAKLDSYSYEALRLSKEYYKRSDGYFDISVGSITKDLYRFGEDERVPKIEEIQNAFVNFNALRFNEKEAQLDESAKVDLGGMGKGFGVDKVVAYLKQNAVERAVVSLSGDIRCLSSCSIDIQDPFSDGVFASFKTLKSETGISTSGNYNRYVDSTENNHLIDTKRKESQKSFSSITLISTLPNSDLDAYATAASVMPKQKAYRFLDSLGVAYIVIQNDNEFLFSDNLYYYVKDLLIKD